MTMTALLSMLFLNGDLPPDFHPTGAARVSADGTPVIVSRAERRDGTNAGIGGEHISQAVGEDGRLLGYTRMTRDMARPDALPDQDRARQIAMQVLTQHAPDLLNAHQIHWIAPHDEVITVTENGQSRQLTLTGMKVKMRATDADRLWFWVIIGPDEQVMVFERDIFWVNMPGHRRTEQWLHDTWLARYPDAIAALRSRAQS